MDRLPEELLLKQYNTAFPERSCEEKEEMSQDDHRFMHLVSSLAKLVDGHYSLRLPLRNENIKMPKHVTIPRLELTAAVVAVKMDQMLRQELKISLQDSVFWTDSTTVLRYL